MLNYQRVVSRVQSSSMALEELVRGYLPSKCGAVSRRKLGYRCLLQETNMESGNSLELVGRCLSKTGIHPRKRVGRCMYKPLLDQQR